MPNYTIYTTLEVLSPRTLDYLNVYAQPVVAVFALLTSIVCVIVLSNKRLKGPVFQHMLIDSICSTVYAFNNSFTWTFRCGSLCSYGYTYASKFFEIYFWIYIAKSIELFILLVEINLTALRLRSFSHNAKKPTELQLRVTFGLFLLCAFITCIPVVILPRAVTQIGYLKTNDSNEMTALFTAGK